MERELKGLEAREAPAEIASIQRKLRISETSLQSGAPARPCRMKDGTFSENFNLVLGVWVFHWY